MGTQIDIDALNIPKSAGDVHDNLDAAIKASIKGTYPRHNLLLNSSMLGSGSVNAFADAMTYSAIKDHLAGSFSMPSQSALLGGQNIIESGRYNDAVASGSMQSLLQSIGSSGRTVGVAFAVAKVTADGTAVASPSLFYKGRGYFDETLITVSGYLRVLNPIGVRLSLLPMIDPLNGLPYSDGNWHFYSIAMKASWAIPILPYLKIGVIGAVEFSMPSICLGNHANTLPYGHPILHILES